MGESIQLGRKSRREACRFAGPAAHTLRVGLNCSAVCCYAAGPALAAHLSSLGSVSARSISRPEQLIDEILWQHRRDIPALRIDLDGYFRAVRDEQAG